MQGISGPWYNILTKITGKSVYAAFELNAQPAVPTRVTPQPGVSTIDLLPSTQQGCNQDKAMACSFHLLPERKAPWERQLISQTGGERFIAHTVTQDRAEC